MSRTREITKSVSPETLKVSQRTEGWRRFFTTFKVEYGVEIITFTEEDFLNHPNFLSKLSELGNTTRGKRIKQIFAQNVVSLGVLSDQWKEVCLRDPRFLFHDISDRVEGINDEAAYFGLGLAEYKEFLLSNSCVLSPKSFTQIRRKLETLASLWEKPIKFVKDFYLTNPGAVLQKPETVKNKIDLAYSLLPTKTRPKDGLELLAKYSRVASSSPEYMLANYLLRRLEEADGYSDRTTSHNNIFAKIEQRASQLFGGAYPEKRFLVCYVYLRKLAEELRAKALKGPGGTTSEKLLVFNMRDYIFKIAGKPDDEATDDVKNKIDDLLEKVLKRLVKKNKELYNIKLTDNLKLGDVVAARDEYDQIYRWNMRELGPYKTALGYFTKGEFIRLLSNVETIGIDNADLRGQLKTDLARLMMLQATIQEGSIAAETD